MEERINVAEILKDCSMGMELNCLMYEDVYFDYVDEFNMIHCYIQWETHKTSLTFNQYGTPNNVIKSKCVIFPKGEITWEGFAPPCQFKDGDILYIDCNDNGDTNKQFQYIFILKEINEGNTYSYCYIDEADINKSFEICWLSTPPYIPRLRLASEEEKQKLFNTIKDNGYKWNPESKTLEKMVVPKFKVEDRIKKDNDISKSCIVSSVSPECYEYHALKSLNNGKDIDALFVSEEDDCESDTNKFDINTIKPFEKVLAFDFEDDLSYDTRKQYASIEDAKLGFIREYSFNMVSDFLALPLEKQQLWVKEIQQALMAGIEYGIELANDERYK